MFAAIVATIALCAFGTLKLDASRELPNDAPGLDSKIQKSQGDISAYVNVPVLPPLADSWKEVSATLAIHGLELKPDDGTMDNGTATRYQGPLRNWGGSVSGDARHVLAVINKTQQSEPVYLLDYSITDGYIKLYLSVVGI